MTNVLDTTIALKETLFADERLRRQFEREASLLARMHHSAEELRPVRTLFSI
ncbi:MAG: hypothetical protein H0U60_11975 [Blastocatellia bacterium]|nr:hypothetical protein [Blastocatellia bacterium]